MYTRCRSFISGPDYRDDNGVHLPRSKLENVTDLEGCDHFNKSAIKIRRGEARLERLKSTTVTVSGRKGEEIMDVLFIYWQKQSVYFEGAPRLSEVPFVIDTLLKQSPSRVGIWLQCCNNNDMLWYVLTHMRKCSGYLHEKGGDVCRILCNWLTDFVFSCSYFYYGSYIHAL